jgi:uncharacterized protein with HEPN domain
VSSKQDEARVRFLATLEIARRELAVLDYSHGKLFSVNIDTQWVERLSDDMAAAETLEAFVSRFGRFQDTVGDKLIPRTLITLLERPGSMIDNLARAERLGWVESTEAWIAARELRNRLIHEYMTDAAQFASDILAAGEFIDMFRKSYSGFLQAAEERFGVTENQLQAYLAPRKDSG